MAIFGLSNPLSGSKPAKAKSGKAAAKPAKPTKKQLQQKLKAKAKTEGCEFC